MDPFELLKADHKKVAELFDALEAASGKRKLDVFKNIKSELEVHTHIEETIFYPALEKPEETHDLTLEAYEEHKVVKTLLAELSGARAATDEWQAKAKVLRENVEHHVDEEENELFDKADDALSDEEIEALGQRMAAEKARKQGKPVPKNPKAKSSKKTARQGIISRIANFVGLGDSGAKEKRARRKPAKKAPAKKKAAAARSSAKARKPSNPAARKRASATTASKRASGSKSGGKKRSASGSGKKTARKRSSRK
jgi:hemerythrin-like domain-containing protein